MAKFQMVQYREWRYPTESTPLHMKEIAANFDVQRIAPLGDYSLHTEFSYGARRFNSDLIQQFPELIEAQDNGVPLLWKSVEWASQFADFIIALVGENRDPSVIEIHPPFCDYATITEFIERYSVFEKKIKTKFPTVAILIENRNTSIRRNGFLFKKNNQIAELVEKIKESNLTLKIAYDVPQIFSAHRARTVEQYISLLSEAKQFRNTIGGVHLWGKTRSTATRSTAHIGDLNNLFGSNESKEAFLSAFCDCFNDDVVRNMVLEVNSSNQDLNSIISDLLEAGVQFV